MKSYFMAYIKTMYKIQLMSHAGGPPGSMKKLRPNSNAEIIPYQIKLKVH